MSNDVSGGVVLGAGGCPAGCGTGVPARAPCVRGGLCRSAPAPPRSGIGVSCSSPAAWTVLTSS